MKSSRNLPAHVTDTWIDARVDDDHTIVIPPEDRTIVIPPRTPDDYAVALPGGFRLWFSPPEAWLLRALEAMLGGQVAARKPRRPTLASVAKAASKAGIEVSRYEMKPDGTVVVVTGAPESPEANPWDEVLIDAADKKRPS